MAAKSNTQAKVDERLGKVTQLGPTDAWHAALLLPTEWRDYREPVSTADALLANTGQLVTGVMAYDADTGWTGKGVPRLRGTIQLDDDAFVGFTLFGDQRELAARLVAGTAIAVHGELVRVNDRWYINSAEVISEEWIGEICPIYPGKTRVIRPETVRERVRPLVAECAAEAASRLLEGLEGFGAIERVLELAGAQGEPLAKIIRQAHEPVSPQEGGAAQRVIERLAAMQAVATAAATQPTEYTATALSIDFATVRSRVDALPIELTREQRQAAYEIQCDLQSAKPMRRILTGDVGTGKTVVYALAVAACVDHGARVAILAPTLPLAEQIHAEITYWWPDLDAQLLAGRAGKGEIESSLVIGTTALLHHKTMNRPDFVVVDEQQRFSRAQREQLAAGGGHLLEASATCIPRSMALVRYGAVAVSKLTKDHTNKKLRTRLWEPDERSRLMEAVQATIDKGGQVLVVYPEKTGGSRTSATDAFEMWRVKFGDRVVLAHAKLTDEDKNAAIEALRESRADILVATTVVEVGISLPALRHVVVVEPQRLGLMQLHQLRGRTARLGGTGFFSMYPREPIKDQARKRLNVLLETTDGFRIAEHDLELRGYGSLRGDSDRQSGSDELLFGRPVRLEDLDQAARMYASRDEQAA
jgi:ATP-dependent DNA helicase RecG